MDALALKTSDGTLLTMNFDGLLTILSFIFAVLAVWVGLMISSRDRFFETIAAQERTGFIAQELHGVEITTLKDKKKTKRMIIAIAFFTKLHRIVGGGIVAAIGVVAMHFTGMLAQYTRVEMEWSVEIIVLSTVIACVTASAAFWIIFRVVRLESIDNTLL